MRKQQSARHAPLISRSRQRLLLAPLLLFSLAATGKLQPASPRFEPAPVPSDQIAAPTDLPDPTQPMVRPHMFHPLNIGEFRGDGFTPGSTPADFESEHMTRPSPELTLTLPLQ